VLKVKKPETLEILRALREEFGITPQRISWMLGRGARWLDERIKKGDRGLDLPWSSYQAILALLEGLRKMEAAALEARGLPPKRRKS
jgi:hypothetical protein